jgi:hypothetical protein
MQKVNHPPEAIRQGGKTGSSETLIGWKSGKIKSLKGGSVAMESVMKSDTVTRFKNNLRLTEQFTESQAGSCVPQQAV